MATNYSASQYQSAFNSCNLQNWSVAKSCKQRPSLHDGYTQFVANDMGHLLPDTPRSKENPWGTFVGTWDMPRRIPPAKLNLTSRSAEASKRLTNWMEDSSSFIDSCNGLRPSITGKFDGELDSRCSKQEKRVVNATRCTSPEPAPERHCGPGTGRPGTVTRLSQKSTEPEREEISGDPVQNNAGVLPPTLAIEVFTDREISGTVGSKVTLSCTFWSSEWISDDISVSWHYQPDNSRDTYSIFHYAKGQPYIDDDGVFKDRIEWIGYPKSKDGSIILNNLEYTDNGTFTCDVKNPPDVVGKSSYVHLLVYDKAPVRAGLILGIIIAAALVLVIVVAVVAYLIRCCWVRRQARVARELSALERGKLHKSSKDSSKRSRQTPILYAMLDQTRSAKLSSDKKSKGGIGDSRKDRK
uniref:Myelin protein P0 n=1 Tax=Leptobrachium leishanense TaxID=445787 RepID=A0A8C5MWT3_9ANUR